MKKILISLIGLSLAGCATVSQVTTTKPADVKSLAKFDIYDTGKSNTSSISNNTYVIDAGHGQKGASFLTRVNLSSNFNTKSVSGSVAKSVNDISKVDIYLLELASAPALGSNPLGVSGINIKGSQLGLSKPLNGSYFNVLFNNVPSNIDSTHYYYVAVVLKDSLNKELAKAPLTPWTLDTFLTTPTLAVTTTGVNVSSTLVVSSLADLTLSINLIDAVNASVDGNVQLTPGITTIPPISITSP